MEEICFDQKKNRHVPSVKLSDVLIGHQSVSYNSPFDVERGTEVSNMKFQRRYSKVYDRTLDKEVGCIGEIGKITNIV